MSESPEIEAIGSPERDWAPIFVRTASVIFVFVAWELIGRQLPPLFATYPTAVLKAAWVMTLSGEFPAAAWESARILIVGFSIGASVGIIMGLLIGRYKYVEATVNWAVIALYTTPQVALIPLIIFWMGLGDGPKLYIVILHAFFPVVISTTAGVKNVSQHLIDVGEAFASNEQQTFRKIMLPASLPYIMTGIRLAVGRAIIGVVVAEFFTSISGLGGLVIKYANRYDTASMFVPILFLMIIGVASTAAAEKLELRFAPWKVTS